MYNRKHLCLYHLFKGKCEDVKDILCPDECNDKKIEAQRDSKLIPINIISMIQAFL